MAVDGERDNGENATIEVSSSQDEPNLSSEDNNVKEIEESAADASKMIDANKVDQEISETKKVDEAEEKKNVMVVGKDEISLTPIISDHDDGHNDKENAKNNNDNSLPISDHVRNEKGNAKVSDNILSAIQDGKDKGIKKGEERSLPLSDGNKKENSKEKEDAPQLSLPHESDAIRHVLEENRNHEDGKVAECCSSSSPSSDSRNMQQEENMLGSDDLKEHEKKGLAELRSLLEVAILANKLFKLDHHLPAVNNKDHKNDESNNKEDSNKQKETHEESHIRNIVNDEGEEDNQNDQHKNDKENLTAMERGKELKEEIDKSITLWGVPLLPSKGDERTNVLLFKFLTARDFDADGAFEMLKNTLQWRKENNIDSILDEDLGNDYECLSHMTGFDNQGNPVCYNIYGVFADDDLYNKAFGTEASREKFLRWRLQLMEKQIQKLDFRPVGGTASLVQINDLDNAPGPSRREIRVATKRAVGILQENYPEFVANNIFINVPFWYYAFNAILSPFLTQRTKSKFVFSRPARVTETLLKYVDAEEIPVKYGGLRRENDPDFSTQDTAYEVTVKAGATEIIEIPTSEEVGSTLIWDLTIIGWDVTYKEEFVPNDEGSYTLIVKKGKKIVWEDECFRNTFRNNEPGKIVITIENGMFKKKRVLYRYKTKKEHPSA